MSADQLIPALFALTIGAALLFGVWQMAVFLRRRRNREITKKALTD